MGMLERQKDTRDVVSIAPGTAAQGRQAAGQFGQFGGLPPARPPAAAPRTVMITGMRQIGTINVDVLVEFELTVLGDGVPPYPVTTQQAISQLQVSRLRPGLTLPAAVDAASPSGVWLDLTSIS